MGQREIDGMGTVRRRRFALLTAAAFATLALLLIASPAFALVHRGHTLGGTFGESLAEGSPLSGPTGVAVNEATTGEPAGDVYVLDSANNRIVRFGPAPEHAFIEAWGFGVNEKGGEALEKCTSKCKPGNAGFAPGQLDAPVAIAIDNATGSPSKGDVYVVANASLKRTVIDKFSPTGTLLAKLIGKKEEREEVEGPIIGVAVDPSGTVWVEREDGEEEFALQRFNDASPQNQPIGKLAELEIENIEGARPARPGFTVNAQGDVFVTYEPGGKDYEEITEEEEEIKERETERKQNKEELKNEKPQQPCTVHACLTAELAISQQSEKLEAVPLIYEIDQENSTGVTVDTANGAQASGDIYLDNGTSVGAFTAAGSLIQRFGSGQITGGSGLTVDSSTGEVLVADTKAGHIEDFVPSPPGAPTVKAASLLASEVKATSVTLKATIDPNGADTHFRFQYGTEPCSTAAKPCAEVPASPGGDLGQGFGDQPASAHVSALTPDTTYYVRVIAENSFAEGAGAVVSYETTFTTQTSSLGGVLPDSREWELVSPARRNGGPAQPIAATGGIVQASSDGSALTYLTSAPSGEGEVEGNRAPEDSQMIGARLRPGVWSARDIATRNGPAVGVRPGLPREYELFSSDLSEAVVEPPSEEALSSETTEPTAYLRKNTICTEKPESCFQPLLTSENDTAGSKFAHSVTLAGGTADLHHLVFASHVALTKGANSGLGLYEWNEGQLVLVSVLPNKTQATGSLTLGSASDRGMVSTAISTDGSRIVWHSITGHLYLREVKQEQTLQIDEPNTGVAAPKGAPAADSRPRAQMDPRSSSPTRNG